MHSAVHRAFPVYRGFVELFYAGDEVLGITCVSVLDTKIVHYQCEGHWFRFVFEQARGRVSWCVSVFCKVSDKFVICESARLWETVHSFSDLDEDMAISCDFVQVVMLDDVVREDL